MPDDNQQSVVVFLRKDGKGGQILVVCNFNPVLREGYQIGVPYAGWYKEVFSSDDVKYGGKGIHNKTLRSKKGHMHGFDNTISLTIPPMSTLYFQVPQPKPVKETKPKSVKEPKQPTKDKEEKPKEPKAKKTTAAKPKKEPEKKAADTTTTKKTTRKRSKAE